MKDGCFDTATRAPAAGQLPTAMAISALPARMMGLHGLLGYAIVVPNAESNALMTGRSSRALNALVVLATKASHFAHGRRGAFLPRTRGLAQHDV
jgi:hypothetical protein